MSKHTPGPWSVIPYGGVGGKGEKIEGFYIGCDLCRDGCHKIAKLETTKWSRDERANANLIAAAPDLLEALENLADAYEKYKIDDFLTSEVEDARAAIAKARAK